VCHQQPTLPPSLLNPLSLPPPFLSNDQAFTCSVLLLPDFLQLPAQQQQLLEKEKKIGQAKVVVPLVFVVD
jgi:hypothetical protein